MNIRKTLCIMVFVTALVSITSASPASLEVFPDQSSTLVGEYTSFELEVANTGPVDDVYDIRSSNRDEVTLAPSKVPETGTLSPGESRNVQVWYNPDVSREEGIYSFTLSAVSQATGETYSTEASVEVIRTHNIELSVESPGPVCKGEEAVYTLNLENTGTQKETFEVTTEAGRLSQEEVSIGAGESAQITLTRQSEIPVEDRAFNVKAESTSSYAEDTVAASFVTENCYDTETSINPAEQDVAAFTQSEYQVTVQNTGTRSDTIELSTSFGTLEETTFNLASGDSVETTLEATPTELEDRTITVTATGNSRSTASAQMNVYNAQNVSLDFLEESSAVCENQRFEREVRVVNNGVAEEEYNLSSNLGNLSAQVLSLEAGEERTVTVQLDSSDYEEGETRSLELTAEATTFSEPVRTATSEFTVENCYDLEMSVVPEVRSAGENRSVLYEVNLNNTGTKSNSYRVAVEGPGWVSVQPGEINVAAGEADKAYIYAGIPYNQTDGTIEITAIAEGEQVQKQETVELQIGEEERDAIDSDEKDSLTGRFLAPFQEGFSNLEISSLGKIVASILVGILLTALILAREW